MLKKLILLFIALLVVLFVLAALFLPRLVENKLKEVILNNSSTEFTNSVGEIDFNLLTRTLSVKDLKIVPTDKAISDLKARTEGKKAIFEITLGDISVKNIKFIELIRNKKVLINEISFDDLGIRVLKNDKVKSPEGEGGKQFHPDSIVLKKLNGIEIRQISVRNLRYQVQDAIKSETLFKLDSLSFQLDGFIVKKKKDNFFELRSLSENFIIENIKMKMPEKDMVISLAALKINFFKKRVEIESFHMKPSISKVAMAAKFRFNKAITELSIKKLALFDFNLRKVIGHQGIFIDSVAVDGLRVEMYKDKTKPYDMGLDKVLPHIGLKKTNSIIDVKKVHVSNSYLLYEQRNPDSKLLMKVFLANINADFYNISSLAEHRKNPMRARLSTSFMGRAPLNVHFKFNLDDKNNNFSFAGTLGATPFKYFDEILFPLAGLKVFAGQLDKLTFEATANEYQSHGTMTMLYHDLEATVYKKGNIDEEAKILSFLINSVVHKSNPDKKGIRTVPMKYEHLPYTSIATYMVKTLLTGIAYTLSPEGMHMKEKFEKRQEKKEIKQKKKEEKKDKKNKTNKN